MKQQAKPQHRQLWSVVIADCEDTLNALGNCYACNKPRHAKRDCLDQTQAQTSYNKGHKREFSCYNCNKKGHLARDCRLPKKNKGREAPVTKESRKKIIQVIGRAVSSSIDDKCEINVNFNKNHQLDDVCSLQHRVNNLSVKKYVK